MKVETEALQGKAASSSHSKPFATLEHSRQQDRLVNTMLQWLALPVHPQEANPLPEAYFYSNASFCFSVSGIFIRDQEKTPCL